ncbi:amp-dependent synthetase ligase [Trichoderma cornu-damae]|uniref:Very long-chain fatty acid transport protein n=1 Tax=Trichoderma cornu-damae TaxID=654480 RepID=A0A9P8QMM0_9HYPO|nr:amp-dependent synthetase ligase [Trichoderma cornu-damae]
MPAPLPIILPAAAASLAYLNAKIGLWYDLTLIKSLAKATLRVRHGLRHDTINLFYVLEGHALSPQRANKVFLIFEGKTYTYTQAYDRILRYGRWIRTRLGVEPGDIVAMDFENSDTFIFVWFALWSIGAKPAFINYNLSGKPLAHCIEVASAKLCLIDPTVASNFDDEAVRQRLPDVSLVTFTPEAEAEAISTAPERAPDRDRSDDGMANMAMLIYTSGTTGLPKPAVVSWAKCIYGGTMAETLLRRGNHDIMYTCMPLYHSSASLLSVCATLLSGSTQALGRKFSTGRFWDECRASKATSIQYVGETLRYLLAAPPQLDPATGECLDRKHHVRAAFGNGLRPDVWDRFKDRFGIETIAEFYAATESPGAAWNVSRNDFGRGAIGRAGWLYSLLTGSGAALVEVDWDTDAPWRDPKTNLCRRVKPGEPGEMLYRLPAEDVGQRFQGYFNNPDASNSKILRDVFAPGDAWFRSGDVLRRHPSGLTFFSDRIGDTFRWKSENVSTTEVSQAVGLHPSVREANVYGVQLPHHDGRAGCAAICFDPPVPDDATLRSLATHVKVSLPRYARPLFLRLVRDVGVGSQTTGTNKQQKHRLRAAGVRPRSAPATAAEGDEDADMYWLRGDSYVPFGEREWRELEGGRVKL